MDEGEYSCLAENIAGALTGSAYIQVTSKSLSHKPEVLFILA